MAVSAEMSGRLKPYHALPEATAPEPTDFEALQASVTEPQKQQLLTLMVAGAGQALPRGSKWTSG